MRGNRKASSVNGAHLGFEAKLWAAADLMRNNMDPAEYKHIVLGLIFLKYISDAFQDTRSQLGARLADPSDEYYTADPAEREAILEDRDEFVSRNVFWVPPDARWETLQTAAKQPTVGKLVDDAMVAIERENPRLKGVLPKDYARPSLNKNSLGALIDLISTIGLVAHGNQSQDVLGRVYEYFLGRFAGAEGKGGGQFYTPQSVVRLLVAMIEPLGGRVYDPCCGSGGMFVQSEQFVEAHGGRVEDISVYGQESNPTTWRLAKMNMAIRRIDADLGPEYADSFLNDLHPDLKADFILANPPFNVSEWSGQLLRDDVRWKFGVPPTGNANFAWIQHIAHHMAPGGVAGFVMANGSMSSKASGEGEIREALVRADLVDSIVALPGQLFYGTPIPACLWFLRRKKRSQSAGRVLFIDARNMGVLVDRTHRELTDEEIDRISKIYRSWSGSLPDDTYADVPGLCRSATLEEVASHDHTLNPGRFISGQAELGEGLEQLLGQAASSVSELSERLPLSLRRIRTLVVEDLPNELKDGGLDHTDFGVLSDVARLQREIVEPELHADEIFDHFSLPAFDIGESPVREAGRNIQSNKFLVPANSILVSRLNPRIRRVWWPEVSPDHRAIASTEFAVLVPKPPCTREYLYALVSTNWFQAVLCSRVTGTSGSHQRVRPPDLMTIPVPLPNPKKIAAVTGMMQPIFDRLVDQRHEAHLLKNLRDEILPRLVPDPTSDRTAPARAGRTTKGDAIGDDITLDLQGPN